MANSRIADRYLRSPCMSAPSLLVTSCPREAADKPSKPVNAMRFIGENRGDVRGAVEFREEPAMNQENRILNG